MCLDCDPNWEPMKPGEGETFDPIADTQDAKRHARERTERAAAGIPDYDPNGWGPSYTCRVEGCEDRITEGPWCVAHNARWVT